MKFRDTETGDVFEDIVIAKKEYCHKTDYCEKCPIGCFEFARKNPAEAARLMGYEVIEDEPYDSSGTCGTCEDFTPLDSAGYGRCERNGKILPSEHKCEQKEDNMDKQDKPLSEWTLGEAQAFCKKRTESQNWEGLGAECEGCPLNVVCAITASEWDLKEAPRLTAPEIAIMRAVGAKWVSLDTSSMDEAVALWSDKPENDESGDFCSPLSVIAIVTADLFPSVKPGECIGPIDTSTTAMSGN